jgi:hypothetical protein
MTTVKNITKKEYPIPKDTLELCKKLNISDWVPSIVPNDLSFELHNTTTEMANAIRRCVNSELPVLIMDFKDSDMHCDDRFIITHRVRKFINLIPIRQITNVKFSLNVYNDTNNIINVSSRSIKSEGGGDMFSKTFVITTLRPGCRLKIDSINVVLGTSYLDGAQYSFQGKVAFRSEERRVGKECISRCRSRGSPYH